MQRTFFPAKVIANEQGFVLIAALLILLIMILIGIAATSTSVLELQIAGADRTHVQTFYQADAGTQLVAGLIEASIASSTGFQNLSSASDGTRLLTDPDSTKANKTIIILGDSAATPLWNHISDDTTITIPSKDYPSDPSDTQRIAAYYPIDQNYPNGYDPGATNAANAPHTNFTLLGRILTTEGQGLQMIAGYEGLGKGTAGGGAQIRYGIKSQHIGHTNSASIIWAVWRHVIGMEEESRY